MIRGLWRIAGADRRFRIVSFCLLVVGIGIAALIALQPLHTTGYGVQIDCGNAIQAVNAEAADPPAQPIADRCHSQGRIRLAFAGAVGGLTAVAFVATQIVRRRRHPTLFRKGPRFSASHIVQQLREPGASVTVHNEGGWLWNPSGTLSSKYRLFGDGTGTYQLEDDGTISLQWQPTAGPPATYRGAPPAYAIPGTPERARFRRRAAIFATVLLLLPVAGFAIGYLWAGGSILRRAGFGFVGVWAALCIGPIVTRAIFVGVAVRRVARSAERR